MHINSDRLIESLTEVELMHINSCTQCATEREKLIALKVSANQISLVYPPHKVWNELKNKLPSQKQKTSHIKQLVLASAASLFFVAVGWLVWSNFSLQHQLQEVLLVNQYLELQLKEEQTPTFIQATLFSEIIEIEDKLYFSNDEKERVLLLEARAKLLKKVLENQKEENYEYSI